MDSEQPVCEVYQQNQSGDLFVSHDGIQSGGESTSGRHYR